MAVTISTSPVYPAAGQPVTLVGVADVGSDDATEWELTSVPDGCALALGKIVERHPDVVREEASFTYQAKTVKAPATISRTDGSFIAAGYVVGMLVDISTTTSNNRRVTIAAVEPLRLTLAASDVLTTETATSTLTGAFFGRSGSYTDTITFPVPGEYGVAAYEYFTTEGAGGSYANDPMAVAQRRLLSRTTATLHVGGYVELPIAPVNGHGATLRLLVVNDTVRGAELRDFKTDLARVAALDATVAAAVAALVGVAVNSLDVDFVTDVNALATNYEAHRVMLGSPAVHTTADTTNALLRETANSKPAAIRRLNDIAQKLLAHAEATTAGGVWHLADDTKNTLQVAPTAKTLGEAIVLKADLRERVYERHRVQISTPQAHGIADGTNFMDPPVTLPAAIVAYLDFIAGDVSAAAGESEGRADAQAAWGFRAA